MKFMQGTELITVNFGVILSSVPFAVLAILAFPPYIARSSGMGIVTLTDTPSGTGDILFCPVESYRLMSIGKYLMLASEPNSFVSASVAFCSASAVSDIFTT